MDKKEKEIIEYNNVHCVLAHSYAAFFLFVILGVAVDTIFSFKFFTKPIFLDTGIILIILGTTLVYWAQNSLRIIKDSWEKDHIDLGFYYGPYKYSRSPTHLGLLVMTIGLAFVMNSLFVIIFVVLFYIINKFIYLKKEESLLEKKYGEEYSNYKKETKSIL